MNSLCPCPFLHLAMRFDVGHASVSLAERDSRSGQLMKPKRLSLYKGFLPMDHLGTASPGTSLANIMPNRWTKILKGDGQAVEFISPAFTVWSLFLQIAD